MIATVSSPPSYGSDPPGTTIAIVGDGDERSSVRPSDSATNCGRPVSTPR